MGHLIRGFEVKTRINFGVPVPEIDLDRPQSGEASGNGLHAFLGLLGDLVKSKTATTAIGQQKEM